MQKEILKPAMRPRLMPILIFLTLTALTPAFVSFADDKIDLNSATMKELMSVKGIGEKKANAIIAYRDQFGPFESFSDLVNVNGFGAKSVKKLEPYFSPLQMKKDEANMKMDKAKMKKDEANMKMDEAKKKLDSLRY